MQKPWQIAALCGVTAGLTFGLPACQKEPTKPAAQSPLKLEANQIALQVDGMT